MSGIRFFSDSAITSGAQANREEADARSVFVGNVNTLPLVLDFVLVHRYISECMFAYSGLGYAFPCNLLNCLSGCLGLSK